MQSQTTADETVARRVSRSLRKIVVYFHHKNRSRIPRYSLDRVVFQFDSESIIATMNFRLHI